MKLGWFVGILSIVMLCCGVIYTTPIFSAKNSFDVEDVVAETGSGNDVKDIDENNYKIEFWIEKSADAYAGGTGTKSDPYLISNAEELALSSYRIGYEGKDSDSCFKLVDDIILNDGYFEEDGTYHDGGDGSLFLWEPIGNVFGNDWKVFKGNVDGNDHTVSGLCINEDVYNCEGTYLGLFGSIVGGNIKNLNIDNSYLNAKKHLGALVGSITKTIIENINVNATLTGTNTVGGVIGSQAYNGCVAKNVTFSGFIKAGSGSQMGGILGYTPGYIMDFYNCVNYGDIEGHYGGGIARYGNFYNCNNYGDIIGAFSLGGIASTSNIMENCNNYGNLTSLSNAVGGIVQEAFGDVVNCNNYGNFLGQNAGGIAFKLRNGFTMVNCNNYGKLSETARTNAGIVVQNNGIVKNCTNYGNVNGTSEDAGIVYQNNGIIKDCVNYGDISGTYQSGGICSNNYGEIQDCVNYGQVSGSYYVGGICGKNSGKIKNVLNFGDVTESNRKLFSVFVGEAYEGSVFENGIAECLYKGQYCKVFTGEVFDSFHYDFRNGQIYLNGLISTGLFKGKVDRDWLINNMGYVEL